MISGKTPGQNKNKNTHKQSTINPLLCIAFVISGLLALAPVYSNDLETLLQPFASIKTIKLPFKEQRFSLFLKNPKEYKGFIEYQYPDTFIKEISHPVWKKFIIDNKQLMILSHNSNAKDINTSRQTMQSLSINDYPQIKQFKALFSGLFQANAEQLTRYYRYQINDLPDNEIQLILNSQSIDAFLQSEQTISQQIEIIFSKNRRSIKRISISGFGAERSIYHFSTPLLIKRNSQ